MAASWLALIVWGASPYGRYLHHDGDDFARGLLFIVGWTLMVTAMMLPTATGLLRAFRPVAYRHPHPVLLVGCVVAGFVTAWALPGYLMRAADVGVHRAVDNLTWLADRRHLIGASVFFVAGAYQWSPLKYRCLTRCRTPRSFVYRYWRGGQPVSDAAHMGLAYGFSCVGCCWALMLVMFAVGTGNVGWMLGLGAVMAVEKNVGEGRRISGPLGVVLLALGVAMAINLLPPG